MTQISRWRGIVAAALLLAACATLPPPAAVRPKPLPEDAHARELALGQIGRQLYKAVSDGEPERLMLDASELKSIFDTDGALRILELRNRGTALGFAAAEERAAYGGTTYGGVCFDHARKEPAGATLGLLQPAFVFDRALIVGTQADSSKVAAWMEGLFIGTGDLVFALVLTRVEAPRRDHPDLELLQCDLVDGLQYLTPVVTPQHGGAN